MKNIKLWLLDLLVFLNLKNGIDFETLISIDIQDLRSWFSNNIKGYYDISYSNQMFSITSKIFMVYTKFSRPKEAMLFKLTYG